jgi:hypothetical protein
MPSDFLHMHDDIYIHKWKLLLDFVQFESDLFWVSAGNFRCPFAPMFIFQARDQPLQMNVLSFDV